MHEPLGAVAASTDPPGGESESLVGGGVSIGDDRRAAVVRELLRSLTWFLTANPTGATTGELLEAMTVLDRARRLLDGAAHAWLAEFDRSMAWAADGARSPAAWLACHTDVTRPAAGRDLRVARRLRDHCPATAVAAREGRIGTDKVRRLTGTWSREVDEQFRADEAALVGRAAGATVAAAAAHLASWREDTLVEVGHDGRPPRDLGDHDELTLVECGGRWVLDATFDAESGARLQSALEGEVDFWYHAGALTDDGRSAARRRADAFLELVTRGAACTPDHTHRRLRPDVSVVVDLPSLLTLDRRHGSAVRDRGRLERAAISAAAGRDAPEVVGPSTGPNRPFPTVAPGGGGRGGDEPDGDPGERHRLAGAGGAVDPGGGGSHERSLGPPGPARRGSNPPDAASAARLERAGARRCEVAGGPALAIEVVRRLCCDADITRVVTAGPSEILDVGRTRRLATDAQRRALVVRARGHCEFPGCDIPASWCRAHHLDPWEAGGPTDLENLALVCSRHHHSVHEGGYTMRCGPDGPVVHRPDGSLLIVPLADRLGASWPAVSRDADPRRNPPEPRQRVGMLGSEDG